MPKPNTTSGDADKQLILYSRKEIENMATPRRVELLINAVKNKTTNSVKMLLDIEEQSFPREERLETFIDLSKDYGNPTFTREADLGLFAAEYDQETYPRVQRPIPASQRFDATDIEQALAIALNDNNKEIIDLLHSFQERVLKLSVNNNTQKENKNLLFSDNSPKAIRKSKRIEEREKQKEREAKQNTTDSAPAHKKRKTVRS